jgi:hypothetical protein
LFEEARKVFLKVQRFKTAGRKHHRQTGKVPPKGALGRKNWSCFW